MLEKFSYIRSIPNSFFISRFCYSYSMNWFLYAIAAPFLNAIDSLGEKFLVDKHVENAIVVIFNEGLIYFLFGLSILLWHRISPLSLLQIGALLLAGMMFIYYLIPYFK